MAVHDDPANDPVDARVHSHFSSTALTLLPVASAPRNTPPNSGLNGTTFRVLGGRATLQPHTRAAGGPAAASTRRVEGQVLQAELVEPQAGVSARTTSTGAHRPGVVPARESGTEMAAQTGSARADDGALGARPRAGDAVALKATAMPRSLWVSRDLFMLAVSTVAQRIAFPVAGAIPR